MGLIARRLEQEGICTTAVSLTRDLTIATGVPRALFVKWPFGHPMGEAGDTAQHRRIIFDTLKLLSGREPGQLAEPGYRWHREHYEEPDWQALNQV